MKATHKNIDRFMNARWGIFFLFSFCFYCGSLIGQISFDAGFENGRLDSSYVDSGAYVIAPVTNLHFRVTGALDQNPVFKIYDSWGYQLRPYHHMVYRYEGDSVWHFFDAAFKDMSIDYYHFYNQSPFVQDTVYIAYWYPYTYSDLQTYLSEISGSPYLLHAESKGSSFQGRDLYGYQITDTSFAACYKSKVVITGRQHPIENINGYFIEGLTDYLLFSSDTVASFLRRNFHFYVYPMLNPDGVYHGSEQNALGQGLNREWEDSLLSGGVPEIDTIRPVIWQETGQQVDWSIDIHANAGSNIPYYWWGYNSSSAMPPWQVDKALQYVQSVAIYDTSSPLGGSSYQHEIQGNGVSDSKTAANWFRKSFNAIAFTFEPTSEPMGPNGNNAYTIDQLKTAGQALAKGFYQVFDTVQALGGSISVFSDQFVANASGGHPPYSYVWTGPVNGSTDTLHQPPPGYYTLMVSDALGCTWQQSVQHAVNSTDELALEETEFNIYPNPSTGDIKIVCNPSISYGLVEMFDMEGRLCLRQGISLTGVASLEIPSHLQGCYWLKIITKDEVASKRLILIR